MDSRRGIPRCRRGDAIDQTARAPYLAGRWRRRRAAGFAARSTLWVTTRPVAPIHLSFLRPAGTELTNTGRPVLAISPDGTKIVFNAGNQLYLRRLDSAESVPIPGTQGTGVQTPFFSADGRWVAFFSVETRELKRIPVDGGVAVTICRWPAASSAGNFGASWTADNQILFATLEGVFRVSADGGTPQKIVRLNAGEIVHGPQLLPDGDHVLLTITTATGADRWDKAQVIAQSLSSDARTVLIEKGADGRYLDTGHVIYAVGTTLFAVAADVQSLRILGTPVIMCGMYVARHSSREHRRRVCCDLENRRPRLHSEHADLVHQRVRRSQRSPHANAGQRLGRDPLFQRRFSNGGDARRRVVDLFAEPSRGPQTTRRGGRGERQSPLDA